MKYLFSVFIIAALLGVGSCDEDKMFREEMYKKVFALVSSDDYNILTIEHDLNSYESVGYVSVSCGGTHPTQEDNHITLTHDLELFNKYNINNFDIDVNRYAHLVPSDKYDIDDYTLYVPAGSNFSKTKIRIRPEGLSPDSTYMIPLKVAHFTNYEINPTKSDVMYRVRLKNFWAEQKAATNYMFKGVYGTSNVIGSKRLFPLTHNQSRVTVGNIINFTADTANINAESIILEVDKAIGEEIDSKTKYRVTVKPYKHITIQQVDGDPDFPNVFFIENDGYRTFKTFQIRYNYQLEGDNTLHEMKEELRLEFKEPFKLVE